MTPPSTGPLPGRRPARRAPGTPSARERLAGCLKPLGTLALLLGLAVVGSKVFDDDGGSASPAENSAPKKWKAGDCAGPDPDRGGDAYRKLGCDDGKATIKALKIMPGSFLPESVQCPAGTDEIIETRVSFGSSDGDDAGIPSKTVCGRNLSGDHPGDPGAGGGQLVKGDCVTARAVEAGCGSGGGGALKVLDMTKTADECPPGTTHPLRLTVSPGRPYDVVCAVRARER